MHEAPGVQEFISKAIEEIQEGRVLQGDRRLPHGGARSSEGKEFCDCIDIPGLNRATSRQLMWPSRVGRCEGPPHSYVHMPFGLAGAAQAFQCCMRDARTACEVRHQAILAEMEEHLQEPPGPSKPPEARHQSDS